MAQPPAKNSPNPSLISRQIEEYRYFSLNLSSSSNSELTVVCGGWERCGPDYLIDRDDFGFYALEYVAKGKGLLTVDGVESKLMPGSVFAYKPFIAHSMQTSPDDPLVKYFIIFSGRDARSVISRKVLGARGIAYLHHSQSIHDLFEQMLETGQNNGVLAQRLCCVLLKLLSLRIEENAHALSEVHSRARQSFERCREELQKHFRTIQSVSELAGLTHFDPAYLSRLFYRFVGESPHEMLTRLKMNEAAAHLIGGQSTVKEIAAQVGFSDPYHFSRVFKKHHGIPPVRFQAARARQSRRDRD
jgi:AraC-like DNA-binding protein